MKIPHTRSTAVWAAAGAGAALGGYAVLVANAWRHYGHPVPPAADEQDDLLERFIPDYDVVERHHVRVEAPAAVTLATAKESNFDSPLVTAIFRAREIALRAGPPKPIEARGLVNVFTAIGWVILDETPEREIVFGAVTQPWKPDVAFRSIAPEAFRSFSEPGYVKIAFTLRADPVNEHESIFRTETRVVPTDAGARRTFRWYWARFSPGIIVIRYALLRGVKNAAERAYSQDGACA